MRAFSCPTETTTHDDIDRGIVDILMGFAALKPRRVRRHQNHLDCRTNSDVKRVASPPRGIILSRFGRVQPCSGA